MKKRWEDVDCGKLSRMYPNIDICEQIDSFCVANKKIFILIMMHHIIMSHALLKLTQ